MSRKIITEFIGIRSKMYSVRVRVTELDKIKKAKGVMWKKMSLKKIHFADLLLQMLDRKLYSYRKSKYNFI